MASGADLRFVALGDSTTVGVGDPVPHGEWRGWSRLLAGALAAGHQLRYANLAVSGATTVDVRLHQLQRAVDERPHLASVIVGVNDTMRSTWDPEQVRVDVLSCVGELTRVGARVMTLRFHDHGAVFGLPGLVRKPLWRRIEAVNAAYDEAHARYGTLHVDLAVEPVIYHRRYWSIDRLHPSELGHRHLAGLFARRLEGVGYDLTGPDPHPPDTARPHPWRDAAWIAMEGVPWLGRRARDLVPWAAGLLRDEARSRLDAARPVTAFDAPADAAGLEPAALAQVPSVTPAWSTMARSAGR